MEIKIFKKEKSFKKESLHLNINFYWKASVCFIFVMTILSLFFGYYLFMQINKESILGTSENSGQETVKKERIEKILEYFSLRKQRSTEILNSPSPVVDPSL